MNNPMPLPTDGQTSLRVRRGRVESVDLYEIKDTELDQFENGTPGDLQLNFAIFLGSIAFSAICSLATATFENSTIKIVFILVAVVGVLLGFYLLLTWWSSRSSIKTLCERIRQRIPPDQLPIEQDAPDPEPDPDDLGEPVG